MNPLWLLSVLLICAVSSYTHFPCRYTYEEECLHRCRCVWCWGGPLTIVNTTGLCILATTGNGTDDSGCSIETPYTNSTKVECFRMHWGPFTIGVAVVLGLLVLAMTVYCAVMIRREIRADRRSKYETFA